MDSDDLLEKAYLQFIAGKISGDQVLVHAVQIAIDVCEQGLPSEAKKDHHFITEVTRFIEAGFRRDNYRVLTAFKSSRASLNTYLLSVGRNLLISFLLRDPKRLTIFEKSFKPFVFDVIRKEFPEFVSKKKDPPDKTQESNLDEWEEGNRGKSEQDSFCLLKSAESIDDIYQQVLIKLTRYSGYEGRISFFAFVQEAAKQAKTDYLRKFSLTRSQQDRLKKVIPIGINIWKSRHVHRWSTQEVIDYYSGHFNLPPEVIKTASEKIDALGIIPRIEVHVNPPTIDDDKDHYPELKCPDRGVDERLQWKERIRLIFKLPFSVEERLQFLLRYIPECDLKPREIADLNALDVVTFCELFTQEYGFMVTKEDFTWLLVSNDLGSELNRDLAILENPQDFLSENGWRSQELIKGYGEKEYVISVLKDEAQIVSRGRSLTQAVFSALQRQRHSLKSKRKPDDSLIRKIDKNIEKVKTEIHNTMKTRKNNFLGK